MSGCGKIADVSGWLGLDYTLRLIHQGDFMFALRMLTAAAVLTLAVFPAGAADEVIDAIDQARKAYQSGNLGEAKQSLDLASQLIGQKNAEGFASLLPKALPGWKQEKTDTAAMGTSMFGASTATGRYTNAKGDDIEIQITGDLAMIAPLAAVFANPQFAGAMGKIVRIGNQRAIVTKDGDVQMVVDNKFLIVVQGSGPADAKLAYAQAVDVAKLSKM
jgi:hypothetical protein